MNGDGLKRKYIVRNAETGRMVENCFVLRPGKDSAAVAAIRAYAAATDNAALSADFLEWVGPPPNDPLTLEELREMEGDIVYCTPLEDWAKVTKIGLLFFGTSDYKGWEEITASYGKTWIAYRRKPEAAQSVEGGKNV